MDQYGRPRGSTTPMTPFMDDETENLNEMIENQHLNDPNNNKPSSFANTSMSPTYQQQNRGGNSYEPNTPQNFGPKTPSQTPLNTNQTPVVGSQTPLCSNAGSPLTNDQSYNQSRNTSFSSFNPGYNSAYDTTIDQSMDTTVVGQTMDRAQDMVERPRKMLDSSYISSNFNPMDLNRERQNHERQIRFEQPIDLSSSDREKQRELTERRESEMLEAKKHVTYVCGDCFLDIKMQVTGLGSQKRSAVRCTHCGFRVLYKKRSQATQSVYDCR